MAQKLGAKPGVGVVVFFTTSRADLEVRFAALKETLDPADGLWIVWPKKASKIDTDLRFDVVQELGLAHGLVDNKSCAMEQRGLDSTSGRAAPFGKPSRCLVTAHGSDSVTGPRSRA